MRPWLSSVIRAGAGAALLVGLGACGSGAPEGAPSATTCAGPTGCAAAGGSNAPADETLPTSVGCVSSRTVARDAVCKPSMTPGDALDGALGRVMLDRCTFGHTLDALATSKLDVHDPRAFADMAPLLVRSLDMTSYGA